jgi:hypothetical protein
MEKYENGTDSEKQQYHMKHKLTFIAFTVGF